MKTIIACLLLSFCATSVFAQTDELYVVPHRGPKLICPASKRLGWNNTSAVWQESATSRADKLIKQGEFAFRQGNFYAAEACFRYAVEQDKSYPCSYEGLAKTLYAQGRMAEAIQTYRKIFYELPIDQMQYDTPDEKEAYRAKVFHDPVAHGGSGSASFDDGLRYALLLNRTGQWAEAVTVYNSALQGVPGGDLPKLNLPFDASDPNPTALEASAMMALGLVLNFGNDDDKNITAMKEYASALQLEPDWALTNYYYGYGWQRLSPADRARFGNAQQAKVALQKAVKIGNANVKKAAQKALKSAG